MGIGRDVIGKVNFVMWYVRVCGKFVVFILFKLRVYNFWLWLDIGKEEFILKVVMRLIIFKSKFLSFF